MRKSLPLSLIVIFFISGCLGPNKINKWVKTHYDETDNSVSKSKTKSDYLSVNSPLITNDPSLSTTERSTKNMLPLLFYWKFDYINICTLNPKIPLDMCISDIKMYANSKSLKQKINNSRVELIIDSIPHAFTLLDQEHLVWVIYAFAWDQLSFIPDRTSMVISYKITADNAITKSGTISIPDNDKILHVKYLHSVRKTEGDYLDQYDENIKVMSRKAVDELIHELQ
jgi:hypothetical protein